MKMLSKSLAVAAALALAGATQAASVSTVNSAPSGEMNLIDILGAAYGYNTSTPGTQLVAGSSISGTVTYNDGAGHSITFTRVSDGSSVDSGNHVSSEVSGTLNLLGPINNDDNTWSASGPATIDVQAKYSALNQTLSWQSISPSGSAVNILSASNNGINPSATLLASQPMTLSGNFVWEDTTSIGTWSSDAMSNTGDQDHMVTFLVNAGGYDKSIGGLVNGGNAAYVLAFEDLPFDVPDPTYGYSDKDYNDLVVQVSQLAGAGQIPGAPLPAAIWGAPALLGLIGGTRAMRRRRQA